MNFKGSKNQFGPEFRKSIFLITTIIITIILLVMAIQGVNVTNLTLIYLPFLGLAAHLFSNK